ncbi:hypothetical protein RAH32_08050 [Paracoccus sp. WLY502]|uniref:hypothetical protein n=1 Tax=Paracoccus yibinensis TaxID=3068891 RepID=UPI002796443C|nr:hypothetical protein [Paracoccus sp. WLY502]MDQ1900396.1 hypothetical protein [Paracoccus sp. WLY502]
MRIISIFSNMRLLLIGDNPVLTAIRLETVEKPEIWRDVPENLNLASCLIFRKTTKSLESKPRHQLGKIEPTQKDSEIAGREPRRASDSKGHPPRVIPAGGRVN